MLHTIVPLRDQDNSAGHNSHKQTIMTPHILYLSVAMLLTACAGDPQQPPSVGTPGASPPWGGPNDSVGTVFNNPGIYPLPSPHPDYQPEPLYRERIRAVIRLVWGLMATVGLQALILTLHRLAE